MKNLINRLSAKRFKPAMAYLLAFFMLLGIAPVGVMAQEPAPAGAAGQGSVSILVPDGVSAQAVSAEFANNPNVSMGGTVVSAQRYAAVVDGISYEAFCADPALPGPETNADVYEITGEAGAALLTVLRYGFPANPYFSDPSVVPDIEDAMWNAYVTRVAVAMAANPSRNFTGNAIAIAQAQDLVSGGSSWVKDYDNTMPALEVNGVRWAEDLNNTVPVGTAIGQSETFNVAHNRRTHDHYNRFRFEWAPGTPAGAQLHVNGSLLVTAPANSDQIFGENVSFHIQMPNQAAFHNQEAKVYLVGIHNEYANKVWLMQHPTASESWQDIIFYIPYIRSSAVFAFESSVTPTPTPMPTPQPDPREAEPPAVRIQKIDALSRENIPGALIRLEGRSNFSMVTGDGQIWQINNRGIDISVVLTEGHTLPVVPEPSENGWPPVEFELTDGVLTIHNIPWGYYRVQEERAPDGYSLLPQHTAYSFWVLPPNVIVDVAGGGGEAGGDDEDEDEEGGVVAMFNAILSGEMAGPLYDIGDPPLPPSDDEDGESGGGVEFIIDEEENVNSILITFENYPFGEIEVLKFDETTGQPLSGAHFRIQGFFPEGNPGGMPIDRTEITDGSGRILFEDLPAGQYTISEVFAPPGYIFDNDFASVSITWGQTNTIHFYNTPMSSLEVIKIDGDSGAGLAGAVFELRDPTTGETWVGTTGGSGSVILGQNGGINELIPGRTYILTEIQPPPGYVLIPSPQEVVLSPGNNNQVTIRNYQNPSLTIIKRDQDTGALLDGAVFDVTFENGETLPGTFTSGDDGPGTVIIPWTLFEGNTERTLIITEIIAPQGYHLADPNWQRITMRPGEHNQVIFENRRMPTITIQKRDAVTGLPIVGAEFTVEKVDEPGRGMLTGNPFRTDANGQIVLPFQHAGMYRIVETRPATNYWLDPMEQNRSWLIEVRPNEDYLLIVENTLLPSLIITKFNALTNRPVPLTHFRVEFEVPNSGNVIFIGNFVTNQQGQIILPFVQSGWYRVTEIRPAPGMALNVNNSYRVFLAPGQNTYQLMQQGIIPSVFQNLAPVPASSILPPDIPEQTEPLPPAGNPTGNSPGNSPSDNDADFNLYDIEIVENPALVAQLTSGMSVTGGDSWNTGYGVWNWPLNSIIIKKTDITNGRMLAGATFDLIHVSTGESGTRGTVIGTFTTNHSGIIVITGLEPGAYAVEEVVPPPNYMLSVNNRQHAFLRPDGFSIVETHFSNYPFGSLLITLRCEVTGQPIQNGEFRLTTSDGTVVGTANGLFRTNQEGYILIPNLRPDSYVVAQTLAPDGFELGSVVVPQTIHVRPDGQTYRLEFTNQPLSTLIIRKIDSYDNSPIAGARYRIYRQDNSFVGEFLTDNQGLIEIPRLLGWFTVREVDVPHGFEFDMQTVWTVQVQSHAPALVTFYSPRLGSLTIEAVDEHGRPLAGATFKVNRQAGELVGIYTTGASGVINIPNLTSGWYTVEGTSAPSGFIIGEQGRSVEVQPNTAPVTRFVFPRLSVLTIEKVDDMGRPLTGATFEVRRPNGERISMGTTNNAGIFVVNGIQPGAVVIEETQAPQGFTIVEQARTVEFAPGQNRVERFRNYRLGTLVIENIDEDHNPLQGGRFRVTRPNGEVVGDFLVPVSGIVTIPNLASGAYVVEQIAPPVGFVISDTGRTVEVLANQTVRTTFTNTRQPSLTIEKVDEDGNPLAGAEFEVRRLNGELVVRGVTNQGGLFTVPNLAPGAYEVIETRPPAGFVVTEPSRAIEIVAGQTRTERFINHRQPSLTIEKVDEDGNPLAGAEFEIRRPNGELVHRGTTNNGGILTVPNLAPGTYIIEETRAPQGFVITELARTVEFIAGEGRVERFVNHRAPALVIEKVDTDGNPLAGAEFEVRRLNGELVVRGVTNQGGMFIVPELAPGAYEVIETRPPAGFVVTEPSRAIQVVAGQTLTERFINHRAPALIIEKVDTDGNPLSGAEFEVRRLNGELVSRGTTNQGGMFIVDTLEPGAYEVTETRAPQGFVVTEPSRAIQVVAGQTLTERFVNHRAPSLIIEKVDEAGNPLAGAEFEVRRLNGELVHRIVTNNGGMAVIDQLEPGAYQVTETRAPEGFALVEVSRAIQIVAGETVVERFVNPRLATFVIHKIDGITGESLQGVVFEITTLAGERIRNPINGSFEFTTDNAGMIRLPMLEAGSYVAVELRPLPGYMAADPMPFVVGHDRDYLITIRNFRYPDYNILKIDGHIQEPLAGVQFEVARYFADGRTGERLRNPVDGSFIWTTDRAGLIRIPNLEHGTYIATEIRPLSGYMMADPVIFVVDDHQPTTITIRNYKYSEWNILKLDGDTNQPLQGVVFEVAHFFGSGTTGERLRNTQNGTFEFVSDNAGIARIGALEPGTYVITETRPLPGYRTAEPVIITVGANDVNTTVTIRNYRDAELTIRKINSITRAPLAGVVFEISRPDGTRLVNPDTGFHDFVTDNNGLIFLPIIEDGRYYLRETRALPGFIIDEAVIPFNIDASARQRDHVLTVENTPSAGLLIVKIDAQTRMPLAGVEFEVRHADGRLVTGQMMDGNQPGTPANSPQVAANGNFITDSNGRINLNHLAPGVYHVTETRALPGYQLDTTVHVVTVTAGQQTVLEVENAPLAGFRLLKIDSVTREPIFGVEFMVFDSNNHVVGVFTTDNNGLIDFSAILAPGRYTIRETRPAPGYSRDDMPRTVEFIAGRVTEIVWENVPIAGQLQILKVSGDDNQHNGLPAGTPLAGAIFEIYSQRTGNLVDRIISDHRGMAVSRPLPLGRYFAVEVAAPDFYSINPQEIPFEIEFEGQIVRTMFPNFSSNLGVTIRKTGPAEVMQGHNIMYEIPIVRNDSTVPLADFFWRDILPTEAVRADRLITGTYNHALRYRVIATTNRGNEIVVADNLSTLTNNVIELRPVHLGLASNEYIVDFTLFFGQVPAGFSSVERPQIFVDVLPEAQAFLPNGMMFANKVDVGGREVGTSTWVIGNSTTASTIFQPRSMPRSGW